MPIVLLLYLIVSFVAYFGAVIIILLFVRFGMFLLLIVVALPFSARDRTTYSNTDNISDTRLFIAEYQSIFRGLLVY